MVVSAYALFGISDNLVNIMSFYGCLTLFRDYLVYSSIFEVVFVLCLVNLGMFLAATKDNWLGKEHRRDAEDHYDHHGLHEHGLCLNSANDRVFHVTRSPHTYLDTHGDHRRDDGRSTLRALFHGAPVSKPLENDHEVHKAEEA